MHTNRRRPAILFPIILVVLAGCATPIASPGSSESGSEEATPSQSESPSASEDAAESAAALPEAPAPIPDDVWAAILDDLARRVGGPVSDPTVLSANAQTWTDGSLGCPVVGQLYTQALVDGYQVVLEVDGRQYDYRVGGSTDVRLCESG